jgi:hypothetical protein
VLTTIPRGFVPVATLGGDFAVRMPPTPTEYCETL